MAGAVAILIFLFAVPAAYAANYVVGDTNNWQTGQNYTMWASGKTFNVGDTLLFVYGGSHTVDIVNKADYDGCTTNNIITTFRDGNTSIPLNTTGSHYYLCGVLNHCAQGMKLAITVNPAGTPTPPTSPTTPSPPTSPGTPNTPSTPSPSGVMGSFSQMNVLVIGASLLMGALLLIMG